MWSRIGMVETCLHPEGNVQCPISSPLRPQIRIKLSAFFSILYYSGLKMHRVSLEAEQLSCKDLG